MSFFEAFSAFFHIICSVEKNARFLYIFDKRYNAYPNAPIFVKSVNNGKYNLPKLI